MRVYRFRFRAKAMIRHLLPNFCAKVSAEPLHPSDGNYIEHEERKSHYQLHHFRYVKSSRKDCWENVISHYRIGTLLFGPSSELANRNANGQLIHVDEPGILENGNIYWAFFVVTQQIEQFGIRSKGIYLEVGVWMVGVSSVMGE